MLPIMSRFSMFDDVFDDQIFSKKTNNLMKTDIIEKNNGYSIQIDIPGASKEDIQIELEKGYLIVNATFNKSLDNSDENKNYIHQERYYGSYSRSYYIGDNIVDSDINASFKNGILTIDVPKKDKANETTKKYIEISE